MSAALAKRGYGLVYGGGNIGLMGIMADAALQAGTEVIGVIPQSLVEKEVAHHGLTDLRIVSSMHDRKALMADLSDGFVAMPGGYGTLEEFCEILTWAQLGLHQKPFGLLNIGRFYDPFLAQIDLAVRTRFLREEHRSLLMVEKEPDALLQRLIDYEPMPVHKWIRPEET